MLKEVSQGTGAGPARACLIWAAVAAASFLLVGCGRPLAPAAPTFSANAALAPPGAASLPPPATAFSAPHWTLPEQFRGQIVAKRVRFFPRKLLALTFDDGPDPELTPRVLDLLAEYHAHATFFVLGEAAEGQGDLLRRMAAEGHTVGVHAFSHIARATPEQAAASLDRTAAIIEKATGRRPTVFRPPYGITDSNLTRLACQRGYAVILWTISAADTRPIAPAVIARNVIHTPNPGDIVLMHDGSGHQATVEALPQILRELGQAGFQFVTVPELLRAWDEWQPAREQSASEVHVAGEEHKGG